MSAVCAFAHEDRRGVPCGGYGASATMSSVVITSVQPVPLAAFAAAWNDAEVVDGVLVDEAPRVREAAAAIDDARVYDRTGRVPAFRRFGRLVSVVA